MNSFGANSGPWENSGLHESRSRMRETPLPEDRQAALNAAKADRGVIFNTMNAYNPYPAVGNLAATEYTPERITERGRGILESNPTEDEVLDSIELETWDKEIKNIYVSLDATKEFLNTEKEEWMDKSNGKLHKVSLLFWDGNAIQVNNNLLATHMITLTKIPTDMSPKLFELQRTLQSFNALNSTVDVNTFRNVMNSQPGYAQRYAEHFCRDPESVKGAAKTTLALVLAGIVLLNVFRANKGGMPLFITLAGLGGIYMLLRSSKKYGMLQSAEFLGANRYFESPDEVRKFAEQYFEMTSKQKNELKKQMTLRFDIAQGNKNAEVTYETLTEPKNKKGEIDEGKAVDPEVAKKFMEMDPQTAYSFVMGLQQVKSNDREAFAQTLAALKNPATRPDMTAALAGQIPAVPPSEPPAVPGT